ncbi:MAG: GDSL family lipase, partial [Lachnospiraceae bacterium]|nr:GDSL family lipase [Lachnospiraceae bacterium]
MLESTERNEILTTNGQGLDLILKGSELYVEINTIYDEFEPWLAIEINGEIVSRFAPVKGPSRICLYKGTSCDTETRVKLYRETQAMFSDKENAVIIKRLLTDGEIKDYDSYDCFFEFVGDSITSGEGTYGAVTDNEWVPYVMSFSRAYPNLVSRKFNARCLVISQG